MQEESSQERGETGMEIEAMDRAMAQKESAMMREMMKEMKEELLRTLRTEITSMRKGTNETEPQKHPSLLPPDGRGESDTISSIASVTTLDDSTDSSRRPKTPSQLGTLRSVQQGETRSQQTTPGHTSTSIDDHNPALPVAQWQRPPAHPYYSYQLRAPSFTGKSKTEFWEFLRSFEAYADATGMPAAIKLHELLQSCKDEELRTALRSCERHGPRSGYEKAVTLLERRFGSETAYMEQMVLNLIEGPTLRTGDTDGLRKLADSLWSTVCYLEGCDNVALIDSWMCLRNIVLRLPTSLRTYCERKTHEYKEQHGRLPGIYWIQEFIQTHTNRANNKLYKGKDDNDDKKKGSSSSASQDKQQTRRAVGMTTSASRISTAKNEGRDSSCPLCLGMHTLFRCDEFRHMDVARRRETAKRLQCCYLCLKPNHMIAECKSQFRCGVFGCRGKHSKLLHPSYEGKYDNRQSTSTGRIRQELSHYRETTNYNKPGMSKHSNENEDQIRRIKREREPDPRDFEEHPHNKARRESEENPARPVRGNAYAVSTSNRGGEWNDDYSA